jgi:hypothetical protein
MTEHDGIEADKHTSRRAKSNHEMIIWLQSIADQPLKISEIVRLGDDRVCRVVDRNRLAPDSAELPLCNSLAGEDF